jgi:hypothetical protein
MRSNVNVKSKRGKWVALILLSLLIVIGSFMVNVSSVASVASNEYIVMNTDEYQPDGVYFRSTPNWDKAIRVPGGGVLKGERVYVYCWYYGSDVPRTDGGTNTLWYSAENASRPLLEDDTHNEGWLNAHFVNDGMGPGQPAPNIPQCVGDWIHT